MAENYLYKNLLWQFRRDRFEFLLAPSVTEQQYYEQLERLTDRYFPLTRAVETAETEFCLNRLALSRANSEAAKVALGCFNEQWARYVRLRNLFKKSFMLFPSDSCATRIEQIAELICKCTQCAAGETLSRILRKTCEVADLNERERNCLADAVRLYELKYYCAATQRLLDGDARAEAYLARFLHPKLLKHDFFDNKKYYQNAYSARQIAAVVDCLGMSAVRFGNKPTHTETGLFVYSNGRNVFDTFVQSRFGKRQAEFRSVTKTVQTDMRYFLSDNKEIRKFTLTNLGAHRRKFTVQLPLRITAGKAEYFCMGNALCVATDVFAALAVVAEAQIAQCRGERELTFDITLERGESFRFDAVTVFADDSASLAQSLEDCQRFGTTECPYLWDVACPQLNAGGSPLAVTSHGYTPLQPQRPSAEQLSFSYRLGNSDVGSFADNSGVCTTLLKGFAFGVKGESVYAVQNGLATKLNARKFRLEGEKIVYCEKRAQLTLYHAKGKIYDVVYASPMQTLFYFPLDRTAQINFDKEKNRFEISDEVRRYTVACFGRVESYTSDALECCEQKLRYKLSGNLRAGNCLAICFARATTVRLVIENANETPKSAPLIHESLVSTYLNYVNEKNVFCLNNYLKRPDCLTLAAICYTNPQFVKDYLVKMTENGSRDAFYYDSCGKTREFCDKLALSLSVVYYCNLVGELPAELLKKANETMFDNFEGEQLCVKALVLLKAAKLACFDKVKCLVEYANVKKKISSDSKLLPYAQAIGALPLTNPSKERLKDLCNRYGVPKSWYYVSQLENLYGLNLSAGKLQISPRVSAENVLEQFALTIAGKRIDTTFLKASVQCMTLNGQQCFAPFYAPSLKKEQNELVVSY